MPLDMNPQFTRALELMEKSDRHLFITGKAGTGKSTLLEHFRNTTKKNVAVLAPTGVAAVNVRGQTLHSFFGFKPDITPDLVQKTSGRNTSVIKALDTIIIDEISMVRADLLDCVDKYLRLNGHDKYRPFGGVQMIFIGDLYQLPPVVTERDRILLSQQYPSPYFFDANVLACLTLEIVELEIIYRQQDESFITVLNAIRTKSATEEHLAILNAQHRSEIAQAATTITLATTNALADAVNEDRLAACRGEATQYTATLNGTFLEKDAPAPRELTVKVGAQVMLLNNDSSKRWVNGSIGTVTAIKPGKEVLEPDTVEVTLDGGKRVEVLPHTWEAQEFVLDADTSSVTSRSVGSFTQYPMKLAWAVTIHKSQGKTFDRVIIDLGRGTFAHGQLYVALSRCRSLEGIQLKQPIQRRHILMDARVLTFMSQFQATGTHRGVEAMDEPQRLF